MGYNTPKQTVSQFQLKGRYARQYLSFAGKSSKDFLLYLSGPGVYDSPAADVESTSVPGRNGDIITENARTGRRRYQNVDIKYKAFFFNGLPAKTAAVKAWLLSPIGYQKLQDTYDPDFFRMAVCKNALEFDVTAQKAAEMELTFNCKPQRWSVDGQRVIRLDGRSTLKNPFAFPAQPIFKVYGDSGGELYVGEEKITIHSIKDYVLLNCETHNASFMTEVYGRFPIDIYLLSDDGDVLGMKTSLSWNSRSGSSWDGKSVYTKKTQEQNDDGSMVTITADFRKYSCVEDSITDHAAYLLGAMNGSKKRYEGLAGCTDYKKAVQLIKDGGYATSHTYVQNLCSIIERWNLTQYDVAKASEGTVISGWYRVRKSWQNAASQKGAFHDLTYAKQCADVNPGYFVYDPAGKAVYPEVNANCPYAVRVSISDLNIRKGPGTNYAKTGQYTGKGVFTIVEEADGEGATRWGLLKAYAGKRNGWISLDFAKKL